MAVNRFSSRAHQRTWQSLPCSCAAASSQPPPRREGYDSNSKPSSIRQLRNRWKAPRCANDRHTMREQRNPCTARTHLPRGIDAVARKPVVLRSSNVSGPTATPATCSKLTADLPMTTTTTTTTVATRQQPRPLGRAPPTIVVQPKAR
jgi:hypothetical protein